MSASLLANSLFQPQRSSVIFAFKGVMAMTISLYIAMFFNLDRPYWALVSAVFLQIRPESGMVIEKGLCQIFGTLIGGIVGITILEWFISSPILALFSLSIWLGINAYFSAMVRRVNFIYAYAMAGITAVIIVILVMVTPEMVSSMSIFEVARDRVSELIIGASCATIISVVFWPVTVKEGIKTHAKKVINECLHYFVLEMSDEGSHADRHAKIDSIFDSITILTGDSSAVKYEGPQGPGISRASTLLCDKVMSLLAIVQIFGRLKRNHPELMTALLRQVVIEMNITFTKMSGSDDYDENYKLAQSLRRTLLKLRNSYVSTSALEVRLIKISMEMTSEWVLVLKSFNTLSEEKKTLLKPIRFRSYKNPRVGLSVALRTVTVFFIGTGLWVGTGSNSVVMMMILPVIFSIMMARLPLMIVSIVLKRIVIGSIIASIVAVFYTLNLLAKSPNDFSVLILILSGPYFLGLLALSNRPTLPYGLGFCIPFTLLVKPSMNMTYSFQIDSTISNALSIMVGVTLLYWLFQLITSPSSKIIQENVISETVKDFQLLSKKENPEHWFNARMGDRILKIVAFDQSKSSSERVMTDMALTALNLGHVIVRIYPLVMSLTHKSQAEHVWALWVKGVSDAYIKASKGDASELFIRGNTKLLCYLKEDNMDDLNYDMLKGLCERFSLTFQRIADSIPNESTSN